MRGRWGVSPMFPSPMLPGGNIGETGTKGRTKAGPAVVLRSFPLTNVAL